MGLSLTNSPALGGEGADSMCKTHMMGLPVCLGLINFQLYRDASQIGCCHMAGRTTEGHFHVHPNCKFLGEGVEMFMEVPE